MKKFIPFLLVISLFVACDKASEVTVDTQNVPESVVKAISNNFTNVTNLTFTTLKTNELYGADFKSNQIQNNAVIGGDGMIKELNIQSINLVLPSAITAYINANYAGSKIIKSYEKRNPQNKALEGYSVQIATTNSKNYELTFDLAGTLISSFELPPAPVISKYVIAQFTDLLTNIQAYLNSRHAGLVFYSGTGVVIDNVTTYYVSVKVGDVLHNYSFSANADVLSYKTNSLITNNSSTTTSTSITDVSTLPSVITSYLTTNFAGWQFLKGLKMYDNNIFTGFLIVIKVGTDIYYISFDNNSIFTGAKKG